MSILKLFNAFVAATILAIAGIAAAAPTTTPPVVPVAAPLTAADAEAWLDGFLPYALRQADIAGGVVVIVKDGRVLLQKGYGFADIERGLPVDPDRTLFRPASIAKLFTWTAVMQLVEAGKLDLDADINTYLDIRIPPRAGRPITLRQLMKHTGGFEEKLQDRPVTDHRAIVSLQRVVGDWIPTRIFDAGSTPAYSNYGAAVAGRIVERVSGERFEDYIAHHIFAPLGMTRSSFRQPLPSALAAAMSNGYDTASDGARPYEFHPDLPAGSLTASGADIARFMIAHLQDGRLGNARILRPETAIAIHNSLTFPTPGLNGMALGFYEQNINGRRVLAHAGDLDWFHSNLLLYIDDGVGFFISLNSAGRDNGDIPITSLIRRQLHEGFADRYFPALRATAKVDVMTAKSHAALVAGRYMPSRRSQSSFLAIANLPGQLEVTAGADGMIRMRGEDYIETAPFHWRARAGHNRWAATVVDGHVVRLGTDTAYIVFDRVPASLDAAWLLPVSGLALAILLTTALAWPIAIVIRKYHALPRPMPGSVSGSLRFVRIAAVLVLAAFVSWIVLLSLLDSSQIAGRELEAIILVSQALTFIGTIGGAGAAAFHTKAVWRNPGSWFARLWSLMLLLAFGAMVWTSANFGLLGFSRQF